MGMFRVDSKMMQFLTKAAQIMWLNLLTLLMSLPVVTAGAAFTAMNYVLLQILRDTEGNLTKSFFSSFRENFRQATGIWVGILCAAGLLVSGFLTAGNLPAAQADIYRIFLFAAGVVLFAMILYIFPLLSHFENTAKETVKNAVVLMVLHFGKTLEMILIWVGTWYFAVKFFERIVPVVLVFCYTLPAVLCLIILNPLFKKLEGEKNTIIQEGEKEE